ncbi:macrophage-stimulating protein receptor-like [Mytilus trossulus]|uniref:macrophage-stimulating protein receptor-like n=1 Tax=Mytilus trossulus TaxID=6551 RepID=UPI003007648A
MPISCKTPSKYDIGIAAHYDVERQKLYMTFGKRAYNVDHIQADNTQGSVVCVYPIDEMIKKFVNEVLVKCFKGTPTWRTPSWQCNIKACPMATAILVTSSQGRSYAKFDVSGDRNIPVANEMVLDTPSNLYLLTGNKVTKLSMTSCKLHKTCGECVTSNDQLGCGWCFDHCSIRTKCQDDMWHDQSCPPFVWGISPSNGPLEGSTQLTITGENFGSMINNATASIGNASCSIQDINDTRITCLTSREGFPVNATVTMNVTDSASKTFKIHGISEQVDILFEYTQSCMKSIFPTKGPIEGKTLLTIKGDNFEIGSNLSVKIGKTHCDIQTKNDTEIMCLTQSCETCEQAFEGGNIQMSQCRLSVDIVVAIDGASYQSIEDKTFCYMSNPEIIHKPSRNSSMMSGGLTIKIFGNWFNSVTNHGILLSVGDVNISSSCRMKNSGQLLVCSTPDLKSVLNKSEEVIEGRLTVILDNNPVKSFSLMIYPDPELDYLDMDTQLKDIEMKDKMLELKGRYLNSAARKEDYIIKINGSSCPVMDLHQTYLICNLSDTVHIKDVSLLVEVSVGANWKTVLGHIKIFHVNYRQNQLKNTVVGIALGISAVLMLGLIFVKRRYHLGGFRKKISVMYLNNQEDRNTIGPQNETGSLVCVHKGYLSSMEDREKQLVAVKTVLKSRKQDINALLDEAMIMKDFDHPNVLSLLGISVAPDKFPLIIFSFLVNGNLLSYIQRDDNVQSCKDLMTFGLDVAMGMEYLCSLKFVHRDLAARNCMVDDNLQIKVANFGLARDVYTQNVYSSDNKQTLPVKWMAPESLKNGIYSTQSDIWSFGVVVWEIMARGSAPYCDINDFDMRNYLQSGERLKRTDFCPPLLYDLMLRCWESDPDDRPTFHEINQRITGLLEQRLNNVK